MTGFQYSSSITFQPLSGRVKGTLLYSDLSKILSGVRIGRRGNTEYVQAMSYQSLTYLDLHLLYQSHLSI